MINGVDVLSQVTKWTADGNELGGAIFFSIITVILLVLAIYAFIDNEIVIGVLISTLCIFITIVVLFTGFIPYCDRTSYQEYKVVISDSVKMTEFNAKYDVVSQEGKIYTITKKKSEEN